MRLKGIDRARVAPQELAAERGAVSTLWRTVFGDASMPDSAS